MSVLFSEARLLDGTGAPPCLADVRVNGNRIVETALAGALPVREGEDTIACGGATLMPSLIEPHAHLSFVDQATPFALQAIPIEEHLLLTLKHGKLYLDQGFTSCFSAAATKPRLDIGRATPSIAAISQDRVCARRAFS